MDQHVAQKRRYNPESIVFSADEDQGDVRDELEISRWPVGCDSGPPIASCYACLEELLEKALRSRRMMLGHKSMASVETLTCVVRHALSR